MEKLTILIASNNQHKQKEIEQILENNQINDIKIIKPADLNISLDVEETADTLKENALLKAKAFHQASNMPCIADDTGLEIDFLNGQPGVMSARFAGEHGNDSANRKKVLSLLEGQPELARTARFRTVIAFVDSEHTEFVEGIVEGKIITKEIGTNGFGYDSIFKPDGFNETFAEMEDVQKNQISHRANAIKNMIDFFKHYYKLKS